MPNEKETDDAIVEIGPVKLNKSSISVILGLVLGTGIFSGYSTEISDRYTGSDHTKFRTEVLTWIKNESDARISQKHRILERLQKVEDLADECRKFRENSRVEARDLVNKINSCEKDIKRLERDR